MSAALRDWTVRSVVVIAVVGCALVFLMAEQRVGFGFPLDDGWIHAQFARSLASGHGLAFNTGEPSTGSTAPLWTLMLASAMALGVPVVVAAKALGIVLAATAALLAGELARTLSGSRAAGLTAGLAAAFSPRLTWGAVSGMEVPLYTALTCAALLTFVARQPSWIWALLCGLATLARPETGVLFPILLALAIPTPSGKSVLRRLARPMLVFLCVVGVAAVVNVWISGRPLPSTFYAKTFYATTGGAGLLNALESGDRSEAMRSVLVRAPHALRQAIHYVLEQQSTMLALMVLPGLLVTLGVWKGDVTGRFPAGAPSNGGRAMALPLLLIVSPLAIGALAPSWALLTQEGRYVAHLLLLVFVLAAVGAEALARQSRRPMLVWSLAGLALLRLASQDVRFADQFARQVDNINRLQIDVGRWLGTHTPPGATVATNDIGAIAFFSGRRILDLEGIVTPAIVAFKRESRQLEFLEARRPDYLVIFDEWYPHLAARRDLFTEVHRVSVPRVTASHDTLVIYRTPWTTIAP